MASFQDAFEPYFEDHRAETAFIHASSYVDSPCRIGEHTTILHFTHVMGHTIIGNHCQIGRNVTIASGVFLGDNIRVSNNAQLSSGVIMENEVYCGPNAVFTEHKFVRANVRNISRISPTLVRQGAQIGANTTVASGSTIGRFAFIEAGTVIDGNVPDFAVAYGNPLKLAGWRCECGQSMLLQNRSRNMDTHAVGEEFSCSACGRRYLRQSKWKVLQLTEAEASGRRIGNREDATRDSHSKPDPSVRTAQNTN
jgi:UDP-2-acetamido-3-amino-2,3-dideoxy-glucuronate N-acetyltransferase